jgi:hypothetical protein
LEVDMQLSIKTFATLANFLQPIGRKDTDVDITVNACAKPRSHSTKIF